MTSHAASCTQLVLDHGDVELMALLCTLTGLAVAAGLAQGAHTYVRKGAFV